MSPFRPLLMVVWAAGIVASAGIGRTEEKARDARLRDRVRVLQGDANSVQLQVGGGKEAVKQVTVQVLDDMYDYKGEVRAPFGWTRVENRTRPREIVLTCSSAAPCLTGAGSLTLTIPLRRRDPDREEVPLSGAKERKIARMAEKDVLARWKELGMENYEVQVKAVFEDGTVETRRLEVELR